jgi:hypothetical protein
MSDAAQRVLRNKKVGDMAVDGLLAGILGGLAMAVYLILSGFFNGLSPTVTLGRFDPSSGGAWLPGTLAHLAVSAVYGVIFALLFALPFRRWPGLRRFGWLVGLAYGLLLMALAQGVLLPAAGSPLLQIGAIHLALAHALYGVILGYEVSRRW